MHDQPVELLALTIPILAIVLASAILFAYFLFAHIRRRRLLEVIHEQRMAALSKGVELPPFPEALLESGAKMTHPGRSLFRGLFWSLVGIALYLALGEVAGRGVSLFALIPIGIGVAHLVYYWIEGRKAAPPATIDTPDKGMPLPEPAKS
jgi:hypothetical protein